METPVQKAPELFRAFADLTRLRLLNLLLQGELCVCDLCYVLDDIQPKISRHLAYLRQVGLVRARREGRWIHYSLTSKPTMLQQQLLSSIKTSLRKSELLQQDLEKLSRTFRDRACT